MKTIKVISIFAILLISINLNAQSTNIRSANFHFKQENYAVALDLYEKVWKADTTNVDVNYKLGICYLNCNKQPGKALHYLLNAEHEIGNEPEFLLNTGKAFLYNYDFSNAQNYLERAKNGFAKKIEKQQECDLWLSYVATAKKLKRNPKDVSFINLGKYINSKMDEETPITTPDNEMLLYTTNRKYDRTFFVYTYDVMISSPSNGIFKKGRSIGQTNSVDDEFLAGVSLANDKVFIQLQGYEGFKDIIYTERNGNRFQKKFWLEGNVNSKAAEYACSETTNSDTLFFSSDREGGYGGMDLYYSLKLPTGAWSDARNCGDKINTQYDEDFPVLAENGSKFYFASNRPESMGGYDVFECKINSAREFSQPQNIGYPLNDVYDNKTIAFSANDRYAYVSAIKPDGYGYTDIYRVVFNQEDPAVKIFLLKFVTQQGENKTPYAETDTTINVKAYTKSKSLFGEYKYSSKSSKSTIALPPGSYTIEIKGEKTADASLKITVPDEPSGEKIESREVILKPKE